MKHSKSITVSLSPFPDNLKHCGIYLTVSAGHYKTIWKNPVSSNGFMHASENAKNTDASAEMQPRSQNFLVCKNELFPSFQINGWIHFSNTVLYPVQFFCYNRTGKKSPSALNKIRGLRDSFKICVQSIERWSCRKSKCLARHWTSMKIDGGGLL